VIPDYNGVVHAPGDVAALTDALCRLIDDDEHRALLSSNGHTRALEFAWPRVTDEIEAVYQSVIAHPAMLSATVPHLADRSAA